MTTGPLVTDEDRKWALMRLPHWMDRGGDIDGFEGEAEDKGEWLDAPQKKELGRPSGPAFVAEQAEAFERFFVGQSKTYAEWSVIWRKSWWPKAHPAKRFPKSAPPSDGMSLAILLLAGDALWTPWIEHVRKSLGEEAAAAFEREGAMVVYDKRPSKFGLKPKLPPLEGSPKREELMRKRALTETSKRMSGDAE